MKHAISASTTKLVRLAFFLFSIFVVVVLFYFWHIDRRVCRMEMLAVLIRPNCVHWSRHWHLLLFQQPEWSKQRREPGWKERKGRTYPSHISIHFRKSFSKFKWRKISSWNGKRSRIVTRWFPSTIRITWLFIFF